MTVSTEPLHRPDWLRVRVRSGEQRERLFSLLSSLSLHTVCEEANCPNLSECFCRGTATFMILGRQCTRNCTFCNVSHEAVEAPDPQEPAHVAEAVALLGLRHAVVISVTRDDLPDGGASQFEKTVLAIRERTPEVTVEVEALMSDLRATGCERLSIGQYLAPSPSHHPVIAYVPPEAFAQWEKAAYNLGFEHVASGPLVRSSWHAEEGILSNPYPTDEKGLSAHVSATS